MADRTTTSTGGPLSRQTNNRLTYPIAEISATSLPARSICVHNRKSDGLIYEASIAATYEGCRLVGVNDSLYDYTADAEERVLPTFHLGGAEVLWDAVVVSTDALADAAGAFRLFGSNTSDAVQATDVRKIVYALDGRTVAVADAATSTNRPFPNAVAFGEIVSVDVTNQSAKVRQFTQAESAAAGWYMPTGFPQKGVNPHEGYITDAAPTRQWVELFNKIPGLNSTRSTTQASAGTVDELVSAALATNDLFEMSGTAASVGDITFATATGGIVAQTDNSDGDQILLFPHQDTNASILNGGLSSSLQPYFGILFKLDAATNRRIKVGLVKTAAHDVTTDADQVFWSFGTDSSDAFGVTYWGMGYSISGTDTAPVSSTVAPGTAVTRLEIKVDAARIARGYVNGVKRATSTALTAAVALKPYVGIEAGSTNEPIMTIYAVWCGAVSS